MNPSLPESGSHHARLTLSAAQSIHAVRGWDRESEHASVSNQLVAQFRQGPTKPIVRDLCADASRFRCDPTPSSS
jgi:hypothetical protein